MFRGKTIDQKQLAQFIQKLDIPEPAKTYLLELTPATYIGNAVQQTESILRSISDIA